VPFYAFGIYTCKSWAKMLIKLTPLDSWTKTDKDFKTDFKSVKKLSSLVKYLNYFHLN